MRLNVKILYSLRGYEMRNINFSRENWKTKVLLLHNCVMEIIFRKILLSQLNLHNL